MIPKTLIMRAINQLKRSFYCTFIEKSGFLNKIFKRISPGLSLMPHNRHPLILILFIESNSNRNVEFFFNLNSAYEELFFIWDCFSKENCKFITKHFGCNVFATIHFANLKRVIDQEHHRPKSSLVCLK